MANECRDRDLMAVEPSLFAGGGFESQQLAAGADGEMSGTTFSSASAEFAAAGVQGGMVLCVYSTVPSEARGYEIISMDSATALTVSVLRADGDGEPVAPPAGTDLKYYISTLAPQIAAARATLCEKLRLIGETAGISAEEFADSAQLRTAVALAALAAIFTARLSTGDPTDANWAKAEHYRCRHLAAVSALRLARDADGDGLAEQTRTLGHVILRRA